MNTKTVKTVVKAFVLFGLVLGSTVDVMAVNEQRVQTLMYQNVPHEYAVRMAQLEEQLADSSIGMVKQKSCNQIKIRGISQDRDALLDRIARENNHNSYKQQQQ
ncbi:hypothetical protein AGMMS49921_03440 [Endomicrobiia bacterium]|nr:hypothetical protein AGMMS49921_03440 [Endomicrobiia bacterium]